ncbi:hypothetical protein EC912_10624 [Luteibacter rhizovicinus]|uniref:WD40 repeat protein n=2 Tax=Luteibacter rhizovicinus TaxID=242606 RepID=A0A4R3YK96_9GAMM|nr:hypothetical protein EC912_10624 [Luteibacter rhizovicinus]
MDEPAWHMEPAAKVPGASGVAARLKDRIIVWDNPGGTTPRAATEVHLLIDAPFAEVQPAVKKALAGLGQFDSSTENSLLAYQIDGWGEVLLSRRPDLRNALAKHFVQPRLELALKEGLLTAAEVDQRMALARADVTSAPQAGYALDAFQATYPNYYANQNRSYGVLEKSRSKLSIYVFDVSAAFGHPATAVRISREDTYPNPDYSTLREIRESSRRSILSSGTPSILTGSVVPASAFDPVRTALASIGAGHSVRIAPTPRTWLATVEPVRTVPTIILTPPQTDRPPIEAETVPWARIAGAQADAITYPHDLLTLPGGDLLLSASRIDTARVWRLQLEGNQWKATTLWQGDEGGGRQLALSADGRTAWFSGASNAKEAALFSINLETDRVTAYAVNLPADVSKSRWELMGDQLPAYFNHSYSYENKDGNSQRREWVEVLQAAAKPPADGGAWSFQSTLKSARQSMMSAQISPVRWRGQKSVWLEDQPGVSVLDAASGRVLRAFALPQRFGTPNSTDATGQAQWVPRSLGSPEANWIATGFILMLKDDGSLPPKLDANPDRHNRFDGDRFVGMHVVDLDDGHVRLSALLGRSDSLAAAARSANGRWLALGSNSVRPGGSKGPKVALWDVTKGQASVQLLAPRNRDPDLHALAFSWSGSDLWAFCDGGLLHWHLPDAFKDAASHGSFPDQSHN